MRVTDQGGLTFDKTFTINVTNVTGVTLTGTDPVDDTLTGTNEEDTLSGLGGNDTLNGLGGNDTLTGGAGTDVAVFGGKRSDYLITYDSASSTYRFVDQRAGAPDGTDTTTGFEVYRFSDGDVTSIVLGTAANDTLNGSAASDIIQGYAGNDLIVSGDGNDVLSGGDGQDNLKGGLGADVHDGGAGNDWANYFWTTNGVLSTEGVTADLADPSRNTGMAAGDTYISIEWLFGTQVNDVLSGDAGSNNIHGHDGNDVIAGRGGNDTVYGGAGTDVAVFGGKRSDYLISYDSASSTYTFVDQRAGSPDGTDTTTDLRSTGSATAM